MSQPPSTPWDRSWAWAAAALAAATAAAYRGLERGPFVFDDIQAIRGNPTIRHLATAFSPPAATTASGRPLLNASLALNYAIGGDDPRGYHFLNLGIHIMAALSLFGIARRTFLRRADLVPFRARRGSGTSRTGEPYPTILAFAIALLWALHPLQTESVTYIVQRAESLMGLFYLLTLYCFVRGADIEENMAGDRRVRHRALGWFGASWAACLLGMATKEVMVSAPVVVLLYDRAFIAGGLRAAWLRRRGFYLALASTWIVGAVLIAGTGGRGGTVGFATAVPWLAYFRTQGWAILHYLRLALWPRPLIFDYGQGLVGGAWESAFDMLAVAVLVVATGLGLRFRPALGFLGAWFFAILAPTSSVVPIATETIAEHRMYLPLAAVTALAVTGLVRLLDLWSVPIVAALAIALGLGTVRRNEDYRSQLALWSDTAAKMPDNAKARSNLALAYFKLGRTAEAMAQYREALRLDPDNSDAHYNFGDALVGMGRLEQGVAQYREALRLDPRAGEIHYSLGIALTRLGRNEAACAEFEAAVRLKPGYAQAYLNWGVALAEARRFDAAVDRFQEALRLTPESAATHYNLGNALLGAGRLAEAIAAYEEALRLKPDYVDAEVNLGYVLSRQGRVAEAIACFRAALKLEPRAAGLHNDLGSLLVAEGRLAPAEAEFEEALRLMPEYEAARANLAHARALVRARALFP